MNIRFRIFQSLFKKATGKEIWYHVTDIKNLPSVLSQGLKVGGAAPGFTHGSPTSGKYYPNGITPIYVSKKPIYMREPRHVALQVAIDSDKLMIDIGEIISYTTTKITPEYIDFEYPQGAGVLESFLQDSKISFDELRNNKDLIKMVIADHGTAAYPENIPAEDIINREELAGIYEKYNSFMNRKYIG